MTRLHCLQSDACVAKKPTGHCRRCALVAANKSPERREASARRLREQRANPEFIRRMDASAERRNEAIRRHHADPAVREIMLEVSARGRAASLISRRELSYIPDGYRDLYRHLVTRRLMTAADAKRACEDQQRADIRRQIRQAEAEQRARHQRQMQEAY